MELSRTRFEIAANSESKIRPSWFLEGVNILDSAKYVCVIKALSPEFAVDRQILVDRRETSD